MDDARLLSLYSLERVDTADHPQAVEGVRAAEGIGSRGITTQSQELSSGQTVTDLELGLFFQRGDVKVALGYRDYLRGLRNAFEGAEAASEK